MNEIQRQINMLIGAASGGAIALSKGLGKLQKPTAPAAAENTEVGSSMGYTTDLSSDEAAAKAFSSANEMIKQKVRSKRLRDAKTGRFVRLYKEPEGGKE